MARFTEIGTATIPGKGTRLRLLQRNDEFAIKIAGTTGELMNSRVHGSEDALATLACERIADQPSPRILIGGLGMGFTLAAALAGVGKNAQVTVAELVPEKDVTLE
jgi:spermidine synthase